MAIFIVGNTKGGVGKSTIAVQLAAGRALQGKDVLLVNGDRQKSAENAIGLRGDNGVMPMITLAAYPEGKILVAQVLHQRDKFDDIVIDAGGRDSTALRAAMGIADLMLVPFSPDGFDVQALDDELIPLIEDVQLSRGDNPLPIYAFLNMAEPRQNSADNRLAADIVAGYPQLEFIPLVLTDRKAFSEASSQGLSVQELKGKRRNPLAVAEVDALLKALF